MSSVGNELVKRIKVLLKARCIDEVRETALPGQKMSTRADLITLRKLTSPVRIGLVVQHFDPIKKEGWANETAGSNQDKPTDGWDVPARESGLGNTFERIRGSVGISINLTNTREDEDEADQVIQEVIARVKHALRKATTLTGFVDSYGEAVTIFSVVGDTEYESGAENSNTTRAYVRWVAITTTG